MAESEPVSEPGKAPEGGAAAERRLRVRCPFCPNIAILPEAAKGTRVQCTTCQKEFEVKFYEYLPIQVRCPFCPTVTIMEGDAPGRQVQCSRCGKSFAIEYWVEADIRAEVDRPPKLLFVDEPPGTPSGSRAPVQTKTGPRRRVRGTVVAGAARPVKPRSDATLVFVWLGILAAVLVAGYFAMEAWRREPSGNAPPIETPAPKPSLPSPPPEARAALQAAVKVADLVRAQAPFEEFRAAMNAAGETLQKYYQHPDHTQRNLFYDELRLAVKSFSDAGAAWKERDKRATAEDKTDEEKAAREKAIKECEQRIQTNLQAGCRNVEAAKTLIEPR